MNKKHSSKNKHKHNHDAPRSSTRNELHRKWWFWVAVGLMLAAMIAYVVSDDESLQPGGGPPGDPIPASAGP